MKHIPKVIGHRGCAGYSPENTLDAIHVAADMGLDWVELDVKLSKDGVAMIFHDEDLGRTTNGHGFFKEKTYKDLRELEAGSWFSDSHAGLKIPTLEEAVDVLLERGLGLNLEIKPCPGREVETAEIALDELSQIWDDHDQILISSFSIPCMEVAHDMAQDWPRGLLLSSEWPEDWEELSSSLDVEVIHVRGDIKQEQADLLLDHGKPILAYTVNEAEDVRRLQRMGIDGFFSDVPDVVMDHLLAVH